MKNKTMSAKFVVRKQLIIIAMNQTQKDLLILIKTLLHLMHHRK